MVANDAPCRELSHGQGTRVARFDGGFKNVVLFFCFQNMFAWCSWNFEVKTLRSDLVVQSSRLVQTVRLVGLFDRHGPRSLWAKAMGEKSDFDFCEVCF